MRFQPFVFRQFAAIVRLTVVGQRRESIPTRAISITIGAFRRSYHQVIGLPQFIRSCRKQPVPIEVKTASQCTATSGVFAGGNLLAIRKIFRDRRFEPRVV